MPSKFTYKSDHSPEAAVLNEGGIESNLVHKLEELGYSYRDDIRDRKDLENNFRQKFNKLNAVNLTDNEFSRLLSEIVTPDVYKSSETLRNINHFERGDGTPLNFTLVNIKDWCKNDYEVVSQLRINTENSHHRYDVIILINGIPVTQIELKALEISPRRAIQQIVDYKKDPGNGYTNTLLSFMQLFIVSNWNSTYYFANNNNAHFSFDADERFLPVYQFADRENIKINHLPKFTETFLPKCTLGETISRYMVLVASEQKMLMMRPYQMYAVKDIVNCIEQNNGNGYIWHTTGSGKTLTSFKASTLLKDDKNIHKCLFVVDRKDLDRQTREEFNKFQHGCVEENTNTSTLVRRLLSDSYSDKVIVTTIQKLGLALDGTNKNNYKDDLQELQDKRIVFIFDECHRSQFGKNHEAIKEFFPNSQLFGFTGTPIFEKNSTIKLIESDEDEAFARYKTTEDIFQKELHSYTITHAIEDKNVLKFHVDYFGPSDEDKKKAKKKTEPLTQQAIVESILDQHGTVTAGRKFNTVFATASINDAIEYHKLFKSVQEKRTTEDPDFSPLNIACVFSPPSQDPKNKQNAQDIKQLQEDLPQEKKDNEEEPELKKKELETIIADYNAQFGSNHSITEFDAYYQDVQARIKSQQYPNSDLPQKEKVDITIVVDMLLTGFDSKFLNTLYVDKNLKYHGLIQAFSRTNRVLNDTKPAGKILDFRHQENEVNEAIKTFSGKHEDTAKEIWLVDPAPTTIENLKEAVSNLDDFMQSQGLTSAPQDVHNLKGDIARSQFVQKFKEVQRLKTQLDQYTNLSDEQKTTIEQVLPQVEHRSFKGVYIETARKLKESRDKGIKNGTEVPPEIEDLDFEMVLFASATIDYDYIMELLANYSQEPAGKQKMTREQLASLIASDAKFSEQRDDITAYIQTLEPGGGLTKEEIIEGYQIFRSNKDNQQLNAIAKTHGLTEDALNNFVDEILLRHVFDGEKLTDLMAPLDLGWKERRTHELALMEELVPILTNRANGQEISGLSSYED